MFKDTVKRVYFQAGKGGDGVVRFDKERRPTGGDGGHGGSVWLQGDENTYDLNPILPDQVYKAENGSSGGENQKTGKTGDDITVKVPLATEVYNEEGIMVIAITKHGERQKLLKGGAGGLGNYYFKAGQFETLNKRTLGKPGEELTATLILKLIADVIFIGLPNAGKSSLLANLTRAKAKIAAYPFTTIIPQLGHQPGISYMDLPGLIEGTAEGKGVGTNFVKHTEYSKVLAHCISLENEDPMAAYNEIRREIKQIGDNLANKPEVIILTKSDQVTTERAAEVKKQFLALDRSVHICSVIDDQSLLGLEQFLREAVQSTAENDANEQRSVS